MNDFVLRGFCQNCDAVVFMDLHKAEYTVHAKSVNCGHTHGTEPVWFLSAQQMRIVFGSDEFEKWAGQENYFELYDNAFTLIVKVLEENPFLVAKILIEAGEKSKEENK